MYFECCPVVQKEMSFKDIYIFALVAILFSGAEPFEQNLVKDNLRNISMKVFCIWSMSFKDISMYDAH